LKKIEKRVYELEDMPQRGSIVAELDDFKLYNYKQLIEYPWRIIYRIDFDSVYILAVLDGRRNLTDLIIAQEIANMNKNDL
jgi:toxin ParE1/3/4